MLSADARHFETMLIRARRCYDGLLQGDLRGAKVFATWAHFRIADCWTRNDTTNAHAQSNAIAMKMLV